jgi:hypothetical protein
MFFIIIIIELATPLAVLNMVDDKVCLVWYPEKNKKNSTSPFLRYIIMSFKATKRLTTLTPEIDCD